MKTTIPKTDKKRVVIVGGGFAGLEIARKLDSDIFQTVLIDKNNYHQFPPLLYQVASSGLEPQSICFPFRKIFRHKKDFYFRMGEVLSVCSAEKYIETTQGPISYDFLVLACGTETNFFGNEEIKRKAMPMKNMEEALALRNSLLVNFERASEQIDTEECSARMNVVVVGGGATGVEIAGALAEMKRFVLVKDYPHLPVNRMRICLVENAPRLLNAMSEGASASAAKFLKKMGVELILGTRVTDYIENEAVLSTGEKIKSYNLIWVSGVKSCLPNGLQAEISGRGCRVSVDAYNQIEGMPDVFALGDICLQKEEAYPNGHPQVAPVAIQQGRLLARNLKNLSMGKELRPFRYKNMGTMATVGRNSAVADLHNLHLSGFPAWAAWLLVHLRSILGVKNKIFVLLDWVWNYFTYDRSARCIFTPLEKNEIFKNEA